MDLILRRNFNVNFKDVVIEIKNVGFDEIS